MALNENLRKHLKDNLAKNTGGGLHIKSDNARLIDAPILAIGLGGTGCDALLRLKDTVKTRLKTEENSEKPINIEYLAIDTDVRTKYIRHNGTSLSEGESELCILDDAKIAQAYTALSNNQMPYVNEWISKELSINTVLNGAGGVRQIGRFMLFKQFSKIHNDISRKITKITKEKKASKHVYVFIFTGISGGTGSGLFIDIPYIIRQLLKRADYETQIAGIIFMPDVNLSVLPIEDAAGQRNIMSNGYAALKELDYLMNLGKGGNGEIFEQVYSNDFKAVHEGGPYNICYLMSSIDAGGKNYYGKDHCMDVASETVFNFIADEADKGSDEYTIAQYLSNIDRNTNSFVTALATKLPVSYRYLAIGSSTAVLPMDDVLNYLAHLLFDNMNRIYAKTPTVAEVNNIASRLGMGLEGVRREVATNVKLKNIEVYSYEVIKADPMIISKTLDENIENVKGIMEKNAVEFLKSFVENTTPELERMFMDIDLGPAYVSKLINQSGEKCLLSYIREIVDSSIFELRYSEADLSHLKTEMDNNRRKLVNSNPFLGINKNGLTQAYKNSCRTYYAALTENILLSCISKLYESIYTFLNDKNNDIFNVFTEMIKTMAKIFSDNAEIETEAVTAVNGPTTEFSWNIINPKDLIEKVELLIHNDPAFMVNFKNIIKNFVEDLIQKSSEWLDDRKPTIAQRLNDFITNEFGSVVHESIDFYINQIMAGNKSQITDFVTEKIDKLQSHADVMFPVNIFGASLNTPMYRYISIPYDATMFNSHISGMGTVKHSVVTNRLFMLNVKLAYPLMAYREIEQYEEVYTNFIGAAASGMHLYESGEKNWKNLPSIIYKQSNPVEEKTGSVFDKGLSYGYIVYDDQANNYVCSYTEKELDLKARLKELDIDNIDAEISRGIALKAITALKRYLADKSRLTGKKPLYDRDKALTLSYSKGILVRMPSLAKFMEITVLEHEKILETIKILESKISGLEIYSQFSDCLSTELIWRSRAKYIYENSKQFQTPLLNIADFIGDGYYEYYLFKAFSQMDPKERKSLVERAKLKLSNDDEVVVDACISKMKELLEFYTSKRNELSSIYDEISEGVAKADFYAEIRDDLIKKIELYS